MTAWKLRQTQYLKYSSVVEITEWRHCQRGKSRRVTLTLVTCIVTSIWTPILNYSTSSNIKQYPYMHLGCYFCFPWELKELKSSSFPGLSHIHIDLNNHFTTEYLILVDLPGHIQLFRSLSCCMSLLNIFINSDEVPISKVYYSIVYNL